MGQNIRRLHALSCGIAVIATNLLLQRGAQAAGEVLIHIDSGADRAACHRAGGYLREFQKDADEYSFECYTLSKDVDYCGKTMPKKDKSGSELFWEYNYKTGKCQPAKSGCFITTACVESAGLSDECFELKSLRSFRDDVLVHLPGGETDIRLYYEYAPFILEKLLASERKSIELAYLYTRYVVPSAITSHLGLHRLTRHIYTKMMRDLASRYALPIRYV